MQFQTARGMRDFLPEQAGKKRLVERTLEGLFIQYGFEPLQTPVIEDLEVLTSKGGQEIEDEIYSFEDKKGRKLGLRFDLTIPLARIVATNSGLKRPFKRYAIGTVYRYDRPQAMRYREFTQADIDTVGSDSMLAEFECIAIAFKAMEK